MRRKFNFLSLMLAIVAVATLSCPASATTFINDDFESQTPGLFTGAGVWTAGTNVDIVTDDGSVFGSPNQYASLAGASRELKSEFTGGFGNFAFFKGDFFEPDNGLDGSSGQIKLFNKQNADNTGGDRQAVDLRFDDGDFEAKNAAEDLGAYALDTAYTIAIIANHSGIAQSYNKGDGIVGTVGHQQADIWIAPVGSTFVAGSHLIQDDHAYKQIGLGDFTILSLRTGSSGADQVMNWDNVTWEVETAAIPEPTTLALGSICLGLMALRRR